MSYLVIEDKFILTMVFVLLLVTITPIRCAPKTQFHHQQFYEPFAASRRTLDQQQPGTWDSLAVLTDSLDSSSMLRSRGPPAVRSIFIAPPKSCAEGYVADGQGNCVINHTQVNIDKSALLQFYLQRLKLNKVGENKLGPKKPPTASNEPYQVSIPFDPVRRPVLEPQMPTQRPLPSPQTESLPPRTQTTETSEQYQHHVKQESIDAIAPAGDATTDKIYSDIVNYNIPASHYPNGKLSATPFTGEGSQVEISPPLNKRVELKPTPQDIPPTMALLATTTAEPPVLTTASVISVRNNTSNVSMQNSSQIFQLTSQVPTRETFTKEKVDYIYIPTVAPLENEATSERMSSSTEHSSIVSSEDEDYFNEDTQSETETIGESHNDYDHTKTQNSDEDFGEDELLKAGEAGMMVTTIGPREAKKDVKTTAETATLPSSLSTELREEEIMPSTLYVDETVPTESTEYQSTFPLTDTTSADMTVLGDFTTPLKSKSSSRPHIIKHQQKIDHLNIDSLDNFSSDSVIGELFEAEKEVEAAEKEVEAGGVEPWSTQTVLRPRPTIATEYHKTTPSSFKPFGTPALIEKLKETILKTAQPQAFSQKKTTPARTHLNPSAIHFHDDPIFHEFTDHRDHAIPLDFKDQVADSSKTYHNHARPIVKNQNDEQTVVRFPDQSNPERPENPETKEHDEGFVRFPSDEVNSIHHLDYKDHFLFRLQTDPTQPTATRPSSLVQKPSFWRHPPTARSDRHRELVDPTEHAPGQLSDNSRKQQVANGAQRQKQKPMLLRFWARMPLVPDLSIYPTTSHGSHNEPFGGDSNLSRGMSRIRELERLRTARRLSSF